MFESFGKIARLRREVIVTEKIDGTNAAVVIVDEDAMDMEESERLFAWNHMIVAEEPGKWAILAQSRKRLIVPNDDNAGFARWVYDNAEELYSGLGPGRHFGEWWGQGIQRTYGLSHKRFSLFNVSRWRDQHGTNDQLDFTVLDEKRERQVLPAMCHVVPIIDIHEEFDTERINENLESLRRMGSVAAPGYSKPEGIVVQHVVSRTLFKVSLDQTEDQAGKGRES
jgi:hypothetical protein